MAFEDLREQFSSELKSKWEQLQESDLFIKLNEKYENLTPPKQKLALSAIALVFVYLLFSIPFSFYSSSQEMVDHFTETRSTIRDLLKASKDSREMPDIPVPPNVEALRSQVSQQLQAARLLPEQVLSNESTAEKPSLLPGNLISGMMKVSLGKLNIRQISDLGYQLQGISPSVKIMDMNMQANASDPRYYDVTYSLAVLNIPDASAPAPEPPPPPSRKRGG
jgi:hypothetical protein